MLARDRRSRRWSPSGPASTCQNHARKRVGRKTGSSGITPACPSSSVWHDVGTRDEECAELLGSEVLVAFPGAVAGVAYLAVERREGLGEREPGLAVSRLRAGVAVLAIEPLVPAALPQTRLLDRKSVPAFRILCAHFTCRLSDGGGKGATLAKRDIAGSTRRRRCTARTWPRRRR